MKAKFLPFLLLTVLLQVSMFSYADEMVTARQIKLRTNSGATSVYSCFS